MNPIAPPAFEKPRRDWSGLLLLLAALALLVPHISKLLVWANNEGRFPIKPRDYNLVFAALVGLLVLARRPKFSLLSFSFLIVPALRVLDAALLKRFTMIGVIDDHTTFVMNLLSSLLISFCAMLCLADRRGYQIAQAVAAGVVLVVSAGIYDEWLGYHTMTSIPGRMAGFLEDPNAGPIAICLMLGVLFTLNRRFWLNMTLVAVAAPAIALTYSRSGMTIFAFLVLLYLARNFWGHALALSLLAGLGVPAVIAGVAMLQASTHQGVTRDTNVESRLQAIYELDFSRLESQERGKDLEDGWEAVSHQPLLGYGTGAGSAHWQPHNEVVSIWLEIGIGGVLLYLGPLLLLSCQCLVHRGRGFYCLVPVWLFIPCSQTLLDMPVYWLAVATCCHVAVVQRIRFTLFPRRSRPAPRETAAHAPSSP